MTAYLDERANVLVLDRALATKLVEAAAVSTVSHALVLQITLATLVTDGTVERVVGKQKLHDTLAGLVDEGRVGLDNHAWLHRPCARGHRLGCPFNFDQAHTAVTRNHELFVVAVAGDCDARLFACLNECAAGCSGRRQMSMLVVCQCFGGLLVRWM